MRDRGRLGLVSRPCAGSTTSLLVLLSSGELEHRVGPVAVLLARVEPHARPAVGHELDHLVRVRVRVRVRGLGLGAGLGVRG